MTPWEELVYRLPMEAAQALVEELREKAEQGSTCRVTLLLDVRNGRVTSWRVAEVRGISALVLTG